MTQELLQRHHQKLIWSRYVQCFLGIWLMLSSYTFGYQDTALRICDMIAGLGLLCCGMIAASFKQRNYIWGSCLIGIILQLTPLIFWAKEPIIYMNQTLIGMLAIACSVLLPFKPKDLEVGPLIPLGWSYNPSSWRQRIPIIFFGMIGWLIARYLAAYQLHYIDTVWDPFFGSGTQQVITSTISQKIPVPDAGLGACAYSIEMLMGAKGSEKRWHTMPWIVVLFGILVVPLGLISIVLILLQPLVVGAWCGMCLLIAICMLCMFTLTIDEMVAVLQFLKRARRSNYSIWKTLWQGSSYYQEEELKLNHTVFQGIKAMKQGVGVPWHLSLTALLGIWLMFGSTTLNISGILGKHTQVCGALIVTFSFISFAEVIRIVRWLNIVLALWLAISAYIFQGGNLITRHHLICAVITIILTIYKGEIKEKYGSWDSMIR